VLYRKGRALLGSREYVEDCEYLDDIMQGRTTTCYSFCLSSSMYAKLEA
jgi:hypothetical protein